MNFKDKYHKEMDNIHPDQKYVDQLAEKMKSVKAQKRQGNHKIIVWMGTCAAAAAAVAVMVFTGGRQSVTPSVDISNKAQKAESHWGDYNISQDELNGKIKTDEERMEIFQNLLKEEHMQTLYRSDKEDWNSEDILSEDEAQELARQLVNISETDEAVHGEAMYYKAVFEDGSIVKFTLYGEDYLTLKNSSKVYNLKN